MPVFGFRAEAEAFMFLEGLGRRSGVPGIVRPESWSRCSSGPAPTSTASWRILRRGSARQRGRNPWDLEVWWPCSPPSEGPGSPFGRGFGRRRNAHPRVLRGAGKRQPRRASPVNVEVGPVQVHPASPFAFSPATLFSLRERCCDETPIGVADRGLCAKSHAYQRPLTRLEARLPVRERHRRAKEAKRGTHFVGTGRDHSRGAGKVDYARRRAGRVRGHHYLGDGGRVLRRLRLWSPRRCGCDGFQRLVHPGSDNRGGHPAFSVRPVLPKESVGRDGEQPRSRHGGCRSVTPKGRPDKAARYPRDRGGRNAAGPGQCTTADGSGRNRVAHPNPQGPRSAARARRMF